MTFHFPGICFLLFLLACSSVTRGTEEDGKQKCTTYEESVTTLIRNTSDYLHDYTLEGLSTKSFKEPSIFSTLK